MIKNQFDDFLISLESLIFNLEVKGLKPEYSETAFRWIVKMFMSAIMDKMFDLQEYEDMTLETRCQMATKVGEEIRQLIKTYTGIDTHELYRT